MMDADAAVQHLLQLRPDALRPVELVDLGRAARLLSPPGKQVEPLELSRRRSSTRRG